MSQSTCASSNIPARSITPTKTTVSKVPRKALQKEPTPDNRLFVRLYGSYLTFALQGYIVLASLYTNLGSYGPLLKEVQTTKSGFALYPTTRMPLKLLRPEMMIFTAFLGTA